MKKFVLLCFSITFLFGCKESEIIQKYKLPTEPISLITADSSKIWKLAKRYNNGHRMNMGDCFLAFRMIFNSNMTMRDNNEDSSNCGKSMKGNWEITENENGHYIRVNSQLIPELLNIKDTFKYFKVLDLSDSLMILEFHHKQFSTSKTIITDHFVPNDVHVENRDFHY